MNPFGHIDLRVTDMDAAMKFYSSILPAMGFTRAYHGAEWKVFAAEDTLPRTAYFAFTEDPDHRPNANRIAFRAENREQVDRIAEVLKAAGAKITSGPQLFPEYSSTYYAVYFEDPCGNRFEVVHRTE